MTQNDTEVIDSPIDTDTTANTDVDTTPEDGEETITIPKKKWDEVQAQKDHWKDKANKKPEPKPEVKEEVKNDSNLSQNDFIYIAKADIHEDDVSDVTNYAKKMGVSVKEAHEHYKPILAERNEERRTASLTQTKGSPRAVNKSKPDELLNQATKGKLPESDDDIDALAAASLGQKIRK